MINASRHHWSKSQQMSVTDQSSATPMTRCPIKVWFRLFVSSALEGGVTQPENWKIQHLDRSSRVSQFSIVFHFQSTLTFETCHVVLNGKNRSVPPHVSVARTVNLARVRAYVSCHQSESAKRYLTFSWQKCFTVAVSKVWLDKFYLFALVWFHSGIACLTGTFSHLTSQTRPWVRFIKGTYGCPLLLRTRFSKMKQFARRLNVSESVVRAVGCTGDKTRRRDLRLPFKCLDTPQTLNNPSLSNNSLKPE